MNLVISPSTSSPTSRNCGACQDGVTEPFPFTMAFQPIVNTASHRVFAYEALVRGPQNESAWSVLRQVTEENRYAFDQSCRVKAITLAAKLGIAEQGAKLSVNFMPGAVYSPAACIQLTLRTASTTGFPLDHLIFEFTEDEKVHDTKHVSGIIDEYRKHGFQIAIDDFGSGYAGLDLFANFTTDLIKLDMSLVRNIDKRPAAKAIVSSMIELCNKLKVTPIAEGIETTEEFHVLRECGVDLMQGYLFAKPMFEGLAEVTYPVAEAA